MFPGVLDWESFCRLFYAILLYDTSSKEDPIIYLRMLHRRCPGSNRQMACKSKFQETSLFCLKFVFNVYLGPSLIFCIEFLFSLRAASCINFNVDDPLGGAEISSPSLLSCLYAWSHILATQRRWGRQVRKSVVSRGSSDEPRPRSSPFVANCLDNMSFEILRFP